jgi:hypothetical protein
MARAKRRRAERGAAFVEAVAIVSLFTLLAAGMTFVFHLYSRKEDARIEARAAVWTYALNSCEGSSGSTESEQGADLNEVLSDDEAGDTPDLGNDGDQLVDEASNVQELEFGESWGVGSATATRDPVVVPRFASQEITSTQRMQCDEKPRGADPLSVLGFLWDLKNTVNFQ